MNSFVETGIVLKKEITKKNELGFGFRGTHTLPAPYVLKRKIAVKKKKQ